MKGPKGSRGFRKAIQALEFVDKELTGVVMERDLARHLCPEIDTVIESLVDSGYLLRSGDGAIGRPSGREKTYPTSTRNAERSSPRWREMASAQRPKLIVEDCRSTKSRTR